MDVLTGTTLLKANGFTATAEDVLAHADIVCYYFSAHWCPPCRQFTPALKSFYQAIAGHGVEVIFVSSDKTPDDMLGYMREFHGDWWALPHGSDAGQQLRLRFAITSIPTVIVCRRSDGAIITKDGRGDIQSRGPAAVNYWK